eukprot:3839260-Alexandrium_andersonii.AAC.1
MSASLVGSEMCIRDSCSFVRPRQDLARFFSGRAHAGKTHVEQVGRNSVSYTHLTLPTICSV